METTDTEADVTPDEAADPGSETVDQSSNISDNETEETTDTEVSTIDQSSITPDTSQEEVTNSPEITDPNLPNESTSNNDETFVENDNYPNETLEQPEENANDSEVSSTAENSSDALSVNVPDTDENPATEEVFSDEAANADGVTSDGLFTYDINEDDTVTITSYNGTTGTEIDVVIPSVIDDYPVVGLTSYDYTFQRLTAKSLTIPEGITTVADSLFSNASIGTIYLPSTLETINFVFKIDNLSAIVISNSNPSYATIDGVLYNKSLTKILLYPEKKSEDTFIAPGTIDTIGAGSFPSNSGLQHVVFTRKITSIDGSTSCDAWFEFQNDVELNNKPSFTRIIGSEHVLNSISHSYGLCYNLSNNANSSCYIDGLDSSYYYTGSPITANVCLRINSRYSKLPPTTEGIDYKVVYENNTNVGEAKVTIMGIGNYSGTITKTFDIKPIYIGNENVKITLPTPVYYSGKPCTPNPVITYYGKTLKKGTDYTVSYSNNDWPSSTGILTINGLGNFTNSKPNSYYEHPVSQEFTIDYTGGTWQKDSKGKKYRYADGSYPTNTWAKIGNPSSYELYHFDKSGYAQIGWLKLNGTWYYLKSNGVMATDWQKISGKWYYFDSSGVMQTSWNNINGSKYYFNKNGAMLTGWQKINGQWYYFNKSGAQQTGWKKIEGMWYYFDTDSGVMLTGWAGNYYEKYYFNKSGVMQTGWQKLNSTWYYFSKSGRMETGWLKLGGRWYHFDSYSGALDIGWHRHGGIWYYSDSSGAMLSGWQNIGGTWFFFDNSGAMQTGWLKLGGSWYYLDTSGALQTGWYHIGNQWYYSNSSGVMQPRAIQYGYPIGSY